MLKHVTRRLTHCQTVPITGPGRVADFVTHDLAAQGQPIEGKMITLRPRIRYPGHATPDVGPGRRQLVVPPGIGRAAITNPQTL